MPFIGNIVTNIVTNKQIASVLNIKDAIDVMRRVFGSYGKSGAMQPRVRIDAGAWCCLNAVRVQHLPAG